MAGSFAHREQSDREEIANAISAGFGLLAALAAAPVVINVAVQRGGTSGIIGSSVFAATVVLLYTASTLYHALPRNRAKRVARVLDHIAIYLLIAGTYTPFTLGILRGAWGWTIFGLVWGLAGIGVILKASGQLRHPLASIVLYVAMGWLVIIAAKPLLQVMPTAGIMWLLGGGLAYMLGVVFYAAKGLRYGHLVWHLFVLAGTTCHYFAVLWYSA